MRVRNDGMRVGELSVQVRSPSQSHQGETWWLRLFILEVSGKIKYDPASNCFSDGQYPHDRVHSGSFRGTSGRTVRKVSILEVSGIWNEARATKKMRQEHKGKNARIYIRHHATACAVKVSTNQPPKNLNPIAFQELKSA